MVAGRLARADPSLSILVIESGKNNYNDPAIRNPVMFLSHLAPGTKTARFYKAKPSEYLLGREAIIPAGNVLGGGSSINFMLYTRAQGVDFDSWDTEGWSQQEMLPLLNKVRFSDVFSNGLKGVLTLSSSKHTIVSARAWTDPNMDTTAQSTLPKVSVLDLLRMNG